MPRRLSARPLRWARLQGLALSLAAAALVARWLLHDIGSWPFPPGLAVLGVAAVLVLVRPGRVTVLLGAAAAALVLLQVVLRGSGLGEGPAGWALALQVVFLVAALVGAALALAVSLLQARAAGQRLDLARGAQVLALLVLAPVCAEYLAAYDSSTGDPVALLVGLVVFVPLYGCPALLIREVGRRAGLGWPGLVLLATAFGLLQAGAVDESLFSPDYRAIGGWTEEYRATLVAPLGISAAYALNFVGGHVVFSICAPIALVEAARPASATRPWLGRAGLALVVLGYLAASALVLVDSRSTEGRQASTVQLAVTAGLVVLLVAAAYGWRRRRPRSAAARPAVGVRRVFGVALLLAVVHALAPSSWLGVLLGVLALGAAAVVLAHASRADGWGVAQVAAAAAAPLLVRAVLAFTYDPLIGEVAPAAKLGHNAVMLALVLTATALALRPQPGRPPVGPRPVLPVPPGRKAG